MDTDLVELEHELDNRLAILNAKDSQQVGEIIPKRAKPPRVINHRG